jgi:hypothetical protein
MAKRPRRFPAIEAKCCGVLGVAIFSEAVTDKGFISFAARESLEARTINCRESDETGQ